MFFRFKIFRSTWVCFLPYPPFVVRPFSRRVKISSGDLYSHENREPVPYSQGFLNRIGIVVLYIKKKVHNRLEQVFSLVHGGCQTQKSHCG